MSLEYKPKLVSVILPTYNRAYLITEALESVRQQTYRPIELIVVDDGSTDDTMAVVDAWASGFEDPELEVRYVRKENGGAPSARNEGVCQSSGEFIQYLDSDDLLHPEKVERQLAAMRIEGADYVWSDYMKESVGTGGKTMHRVELGSRVAASAVIGLFTRGVVTTVGKWREDLPFSQDWNYTVRLLATEPRKTKVEGIFYTARVGGADRISAIRVTDPDRLAKELSILESTTQATGVVCKDSRRLVCGKAVELMLKASSKASWRGFCRARNVYIDAVGRNSDRAGFRYIVIKYMYPALFGAFFLSQRARGVWG